MAFSHPKFQGWLFFDPGLHHQGPKPGAEQSPKQWTSKRKGREKANTPKSRPTPAPAADQRLALRRIEARPNANRSATRPRPKTPKRQRAQARPVAIRQQQSKSIHLQEARSSLGAGARACQESPAAAPTEPSTRTSLETKGCSSLRPSGVGPPPGNSEFCAATARIVCLLLF